MPRSEDVLLDVFHCLSRYDLDTATLVCRQYHQLIASKMLTVCLRPLTNVQFEPYSWHSEETNKNRTSDPDSEIVYRVEYKCKKSTHHYTRTLHHTDEFACHSQAVEHLIGVLRCSCVENLSLTFDLFDRALSEAFLVLFKSLRAEIVDMTFPEDAVDVLSCLQALVVEKHLHVMCPPTRVSTRLFAAVAPLKLSYFALHVNCPKQPGAYDVMDDAIVAYLFHQQDGSYLRTTATVSSAFLGKLLKKFNETPTSALCSINAQIDCPKQVIPAVFPQNRSYGFGGEVAYTWTKDIPRSRSVLNVRYRIFPANGYVVELATWLSC